MMTLLKLRRGKYSLVEEKMPAGAKAIGVAIKDLPLPGRVRHRRHHPRGDVVVPRGITTFEEGDEVLSVVRPECAEELAALFAPPAGQARAKQIGCTPVGFRK